MNNLFYIDYPQEQLEGQAHTYRCAFCKVITTTINGNLSGHLPSCQYRINLEKAGHKATERSAQAAINTTDEND